MRFFLPIMTLLVAGAAWADDVPTFYRCGKVLSDRLMPACADAVMREQRLEAERTKKAAEKEMAAQRELAWWLWKYPNPAAIERERQESLRETRKYMAISVARIAELENERRALVCPECDRGKPMPQSLREAIDAKESTLSAQRQLASFAPHQLKRIDGMYDSILARMKELWKKAPIESLRARVP